jgi:hypothetical protein
MTFNAKFFVDDILPEVLAAKPGCDPLGDWFSV